LPKLIPISWRELVATLKALGFIGPYEGGKLPYMVKGDLVFNLAKSTQTGNQCRFIEKAIKTSRH